jgi:FKBP-type peptidyl-prolyl cis-trans isomerase FklB
MKYLLMTALLAFTVVSCGDDSEKEGKKEEKAVELTTDMDKWSYTLGYQRGSQLMSPQNPNKDQFANYKKQFIAGFSEGYKEMAPDEQQQCMMAIQGMLGGAQGAAFDPTKADSGCKSYGVYTASSTYMQFKQLDILELIDVAKLKAGFADGINEAQKRVSDEEADKVMTALDAKINEMNETKYGGNKKLGEDFLAENANKPGIKVTESGLQYEVLKAGSGAKPTVSSQVTVHYTGSLIDGTVFESSVESGQPASFGVTQVIKGWTEALLLMPKGSKYKLYIPQELAYGANPRPGQIKPYMALIFEIELLEITDGPVAGMPTR